jgi:uncharacterized protein YndB with AHSA1/START domain
MHDAVTCEATIAAPRGSVWHALTEPVQLARWFGRSAEVDPRRGGGVRFGWLPDEICRGVVVDIDPPRRFAFRWDAFGTIRDPGLYTRVEFRLYKDEQDTRVVVVESGFAALVDLVGEEHLAQVLHEHVEGWRNEMGDLVRYLAAPESQIGHDGMHAVILSDRSGKH